MLFEYALILHPTKDEADAGTQPVLIKATTTIVAKDQGMAILLAGKEIPKDYLDKLDRVEVAVRPF